MVKSTSENGFFLDDSQSAGQDCNRGERQNAATINYRRTFTVTSSSTLLELFMSQPGKLNSHTRISTRRFTRTHIKSIGNLESADFGGMDSSAVISAGSLGSPRMNSFAADQDIHGVSSADLLHLIPTNGDLLEGICNHNSFIKVGNFGANKNQMENVGDQECPTCGGQNIVDSASKESDHNHASAENVNRAGHKVTTSRSKYVRVTHEISLSRKVAL